MGKHEWPKEPLNKICRFQSGGTPSTKHPEFYEGSIPWITSADITESGSADPKKFISNEAIASSAASLVPSNTLLLVTRIGVGKTHITTEELSFSQDVTALREIDSRIDINFLRLFLRSSKQFFDSRSRGVTIKGISRDALKDLMIPIPPVDEQRRIAGILDSIEVAKAQNLQALEGLEAIVLSEFNALFHGAQTTLKGLEELVESGTDIKCGPFGTQLKKDEFQDTGIPLWGIKNVNSGFKIPAWEFLSESKADELSTYSVEAGDIVMTRKGTIGNCALFPPDLTPGIMHSDLLRIRPGKKIQPAFLAFHLQHSHSIREQIRKMSPGAVMPGINVSKLKKLKIEVPPRDLQDKFVEFLSKTQELNSLIEQRHQLLTKLQSSLSTRAFRGEL